MSATLISQLRYKDFIYLADILDHNLPFKNWNSLGRMIIEEKSGISSNQIDFLKHGFVEEESSSWRFLQDLSAKVPSCSVSSLKKIARQFKRNDIYYFLDSLHDQSVDVWALPLNETKRLVYYLELSCITTADWRMFADKLGYSYVDIKRISNRTQHLERPTVLLLNLLTSKYPDFSLEELRDICMKAPDSYSTLIQRINHICSYQRWTSNGV